MKTTFPALKNIQKALDEAGVGDTVKAVVPLNADVYVSPDDKPSSGAFRPDINGLMTDMVKFLHDHGAPFVVNIYPFLSLYQSDNFPFEFAFFDGGKNIQDKGGVTYSNVFDANYDTLVHALKKAGVPDLKVIVGEAGWPTDGNKYANFKLARRFYDGLLRKLAKNEGTPVRKGKMEVYLFGLFDEDMKSIAPGNFERHWGIFTYDGLPKYQLNLGTSNAGGGLVRAKGVKYLERKWCVLKPSVNLNDPKLADNVGYACSMADCTSLGYKTSCGMLDIRGNVSYAFNNYFQKNDQDDVACGFQGLATTTGQDPSTGTCRFGVMIEVDSAFSWRLQGLGSNLLLFLLLGVLQLSLSFS